MSFCSQRVREGLMHVVAIGSVLAVVIALRPTETGPPSGASPADGVVGGYFAEDEGSSAHMKNPEHLKSCSVCRFTQHQRAARRARSYTASTTPRISDIDLSGARR